MVIRCSFTGSVGSIAAPFGIVTVGFIIDRYGRKKALIFGMLPFVIGWLLLYSDYSTAVALLGQILHGLTNSAIVYPTQVYAGECVMINHNRLRNNFMMSIGLSSAFGMTTMLAMGTLLNYHDICAVNVIVSATILLLFCIVVPESPLWLYHNGRIGDAEWSQKVLGISQPILQQREANSGPPAMSSTGTFQWSSFKSVIQRIKRDDVFKPLTLLTIFSFLSPWQGSTVVSIYLISILDDAIPGTASTVKSNSFNASNSGPTYEVFKNTTANIASTIAPRTLPNTGPSASYTFGLISGILSVVANLVACVAMPYTGIKNLIIFCNLSKTVGFALLAHTVISESNENLLALRVVAVGLIVFTMGVTMGLPSALGGEIFPHDSKGFASVPVIMSSLSAGLVIKAFPYLYLVFGPFVYYIFATFCIFNALYTYLYLPEIAGKTLKQINEEFSTKQLVNGSA